MATRNGGSVCCSFDALGVLSAALTTICPHDTIEHDAEDHHDRQQESRSQRHSLSLKLGGAEAAAIRSAAGSGNGLADRGCRQSPVGLTAVPRPAIDARTSCNSRSGRTAHLE
jgi:hypothetical protein